MKEEKLTKILKELFEGKQSVDTTQSQIESLFPNLYTQSLPSPKLFSEEAVREILDNHSTHIFMKAELAKAISALVLPSEERKMNEEISKEAIGLLSKQYDDEETGMEFKRRMGFIKHKYNLF
jgi:hypothetical protein